MSALAPPQQESADGATASRRRHHWEMLTVALFVIVAALVLRVRDDERVAIAGAPWLRLPSMCGSQAIFGTSCPGCGLTRSVVRLAAGDVRGSFAQHRLGWLMAILILAQIPYRMAALRSSTQRPLGEGLPKAIGWILVAALIVNWLVGRS